MKINHSAFTLIELLVVITIIGLISSAALLVLKDTAEVKALLYTKKVMTSVKKGIADIDSDGYMRGFVNDFGTMPPHVCFLIGKQDDNGSFNFVENKLAGYRFTDMTNQDSTNFPAPFMPESSELNGTIKKVLYVGYHGGYMSDIENVFKDGWQVDIKMQSDMNISNNNGEDFLTLISAGSDRLFSGVGSSLMREEFDFAQEDGSIEELYADDTNQTYRKNSFLVSSLDIDIDLDVDDANETAIFIYSSMLYYAKDSENESCVENNTTHALCAGSNDREYIPYYLFADNFDSSIKDKNVSWHVGLMKQELYFNDQNESRLFINQKDILDSSEDIYAYDFNSSDYNITDSIFFGNIYVDLNNTEYISIDEKDGDNPFYIYGGSKIISIWYKKRGGSDNWIQQESFAQDFKPNTKNTIKNAGN